MTIAVLLVAVVVLAGTVVTSASSLWARRTADADRERLTAAAVEVALLLSSLSVDDAELSLDRLTELSTGDLHEELAARRDEVLRTVDDDEVRSSSEVIASGVEQDVTPRRLLDGSDDPARARLLVAVRSDVSNASTDGTASTDDPGARTPTADSGNDERPTGERLWRWRLEAELVGGRALVSSAELAV